MKREKAALDKHNRCVNCFGYTEQKCRALKEWYNENEFNCVQRKKSGKRRICPFFKVKKEKTHGG